MKSKFYILLFCIVIFLLTALGLVIAYIDKPFLTFYSIFAYPIALLCVYVFLVQPLLTELDGRKLVFLAFSVTIIAIPVTHSVWTIITPNWSFSVSTDKSIYNVGEQVQIRASLENHGFISHSFASSMCDPIVVTVSYVHTKPTTKTEVWFSHHIYSSWKAEFIIPPHQSVERSFTWNQSNIHRPDIKIKAGTYLVEAIIPSRQVGVDENLFWAWTYINITAT